MSGIVLAALMNVAVMGAADEQFLDRRMYVRVAIGANGRAEQLEFPKATAEPLKVEFERRIRNWLFKSPTFDGRPVSMKTSLALDVRLSALASGGTRVRILRASTGVEPLKVVLPGYSTRQARAGMSGSVTVRCTVAADGRCATYAVQAATAPQPLQESVRLAVARWRFLPEEIGGVTMQSDVIIPFCFQAGRQSRVSDCVDEAPFLAGSAAELVTTDLDR